MEMCIHYAKIQTYEQGLFETRVYKPVQCLKFIKNAPFPQVPNLAKHCLLSVTQEIDIRELVKLSATFKTTRRGKRQIENQVCFRLCHYLFNRNLSNWNIIGSVTTFPVFRKTKSGSVVPNTISA